MSRIFGTPEHIGIVVPDLAVATGGLAALGIGPVYMMDRITVPSRYRGTRYDVRLSVCFAYSGGMLFEYVEQHDDLPSSYRERPASGGIAPHHIAYFSDDFAATIARAEAGGARFSVVQEFFDEATGEPYEIYLENRDLPTAPLVQLMVHPPFDPLYTAMRASAQGWDGSRPVRNALELIPEDIRPPSG